MDHDREGLHPDLELLEFFLFRLYQLELLLFFDAQELDVVELDTELVELLLLLQPHLARHEVFEDLAFDFLPFFLLLQYLLIDLETLDVKDVIQIGVDVSVQVVENLYVIFLPLFEDLQELGDQFM